MNRIFNWNVLTLQALFCLGLSTNLIAQDSKYIIKSKDFPLENKTIGVPQIYSTKGEETVNLKALNEKIIERINIISCAPKSDIDYERFVGSLHFFEDFAGYLDIKYTYALAGNFAEINIEGNYAEFEGKPAFEIYQIYKKETFYIDISNGEIFDSSGFDNKILLKYFFEPKGFLELLSNTWIPRIREIQKKYPDMEYEYTCEDCSSPNAYMHPFDFEWEFKKDSLYFSLKSVAYFRDYCFQSFCSPQFTVGYPTKNLTPWLRKNFDFKQYNDLDRLSRIVFYKENLEKSLKESRLISGRIDGKYPFLMVLSLVNNEVSGNYMYTSNRKFLELRGFFSDVKKIDIYEYLNNELTGKFTLEFKGDLTSEFDVKSFRWYSPDGKKSYEVKVDDFEIY